MYSLYQAPYSQSDYYKAGFFDIDGGHIKSNEIRVDPRTECIECYAYGVILMICIIVISILITKLIMVFLKEENKEVKITQPTNAMSKADRYKYGISRDYDEMWIHRESSKSKLINSNDEMWRSDGGKPNYGNNYAGDSALNRFT